jgi:uncharacterized protein (TIGR02271 family)
MTKTIVGVYNSIQIAHSVINELVQSGFDRKNISLVANDAEKRYAGYLEDDSSRDVDGGDVAKGAGIGAAIGGLGGILLGMGALAIPGIGPIIAAGPIAAGLAGAGIGAATGGIVGALVDLGIPDEDAHLYSESVRRGNVLVILQVADSQVNKAAQIMERGGLVDLDRHSQQWRSEGWRGFDANAGEYRRQTAARDASRSGKDDETIEVVEEDIKVGKRAVQEGGVRVRSYVRDVPVEEDVRLRSEEVHVERRPVNRPATAADLDNFREGTVEMTEMHEEAVVSKEARVVEEVSLHKDVEEHVEKVRDSVRHTEVEVEKIAGGKSRGQDVSHFDTDFRTHFDTTYGKRGKNFTTYQPAYRYGYELANDSRYQGRQWREVEPEVRREWESRNRGSAWEDFKDSVQYGWDRVRGRA